MLSVRVSICLPLYSLRIHRAQTIGTYLAAKCVCCNGRRTNLMLWGPTALERFRSMHLIYSQGAHILLGMFKRSDRHTLEEACLLLKETREQALDSVAFLLESMIDEKGTEVTDAEIDGVLAELKIPRERYLRVSAKTGEGIPELERALTEVGCEILDSMPPTMSEPLSNDNDGGERSCTIC